MAVHGLLFVLVGPSGAGKNTIMKQVLPKVNNLRQLPTATTRASRNDEREGREHFFHTNESFDQLIEQEALLEWQWVHDNRYGIVRAPLEEAINTQEDLIADIEVLGASILSQEYPQNAILIFITSSERSTLKERIEARAADSQDRVKRRMQRVDYEMKYAAKCDYLVINNDLETAVNEIASIILAERCRRSARNLAVSVMVFHKDQVLVKKGSLDTLPQIALYKGERPVEAVYRLTNMLGVGAITLCCQPAAPQDGVAPVQFAIDDPTGLQNLNLIFACTVDDPNEKLIGWAWQPVEAVSLARQYRENTTSTG
ncbi:guanylate kinase [Chloroflexota bacterium]